MKRQTSKRLLSLLLSLMLVVSLVPSASLSAFADGEVTGVSLDKTELTIKEGDTTPIQLTATVLPDDATNKTYGGRANTATLPM